MLYRSIKTTLLIFMLVLGHYAFSQNNSDYENDWEQSEGNVNVKQQKQEPKNEQSQQSEQKSQKAMEKDDDDNEDNEQSDSNPIRRFHEVLDELLAEFGYDVRMGQIKDLKNVAIRKVLVSEALPKSYQNYLELLVAERIRENSKVRVISCLPCKSRTSRLIEGKLMITSPLTNMDQLQRAADQLGIDYFMDVVLVYHTTHMVLAFQAFNTETKEMVWARTYNSETIKSRFQKLAIDYSQVEKARPESDYVPEYRLMIGLGGAFIPNVIKTDDTGMIDLSVRGTEKFDNRLAEFGLIFSVYQSKSSILSAYPTEGGSESSTSSTSTTTSSEPTPTPFTTALCLTAIYQRNFFGNIESYDQVRHGVNGGLGFVLAASYIAPALRVGWDVFMGKRFVISSAALYHLSSKILVDSELVSTPGGAGAELLLSVNF